MSKLKIEGGIPLRGETELQGSKNAVLPILAASLLAKGPCEIENVPRLSDVRAALEILRHLGCSASMEGRCAAVDTKGLCRWEIPEELMGRMRSSVMFLGAILARMGRVSLTLPGGCELGPRPIDLHLDAMRALGAQVSEEGGRLTLTAEALHGGTVLLRLPSVGATENALIAACLAKGETEIINAAREPEIEDLAAFLTAMGARVSGAGTSRILVEGTASLHGARHRVIPDRIAAATCLAACAAAGGEVTVKGARQDHLGAFLAVLEKMGVSLEFGADYIRARVPGQLKSPGTVETGPYPAFPTDGQPPLLAACLTAAGETKFVENMFENRFRHVSELMKMGARAQVRGRVCTLRGGQLHGAQVEAADLRGGAALAVAALAARGESLIGGLSHIERGYDGLAGVLQDLGARAFEID